jgi:hypothetical protein
MRRYRFDASSVIGSISLVRLTTASTGEVYMPTKSRKASGGKVRGTTGGGIATGTYDLSLTVTGPVHFAATFPATWLIKCSGVGVAGGQIVATIRDFASNAVLYQSTTRLLLPAGGKVGENDIVVSPPSPAEELAALYLDFNPLLEYLTASNILATILAAGDSAVGPLQTQVAAALSTAQTLSAVISPDFTQLQSQLSDVVNTAQGLASTSEFLPILQGFLAGAQSAEQTLDATQHSLQLVLTVTLNGSLVEGEAYAGFTVSPDMVPLAPTEIPLSSFEFALGAAPSILELTKIPLVPVSRFGVGLPPKIPYWTNSVDCYTGPQRDVFFSNTPGINPSGPYGLTTPGHQSNSPKALWSGTRYRRLPPPSVPTQPTTRIATNSPITWACPATPSIRTSLASKTSSSTHSMAGVTLTLPCRSILNCEGSFLQQTSCNTQV